MLPRSRPLSWYKASVKVLDTGNSDVHKVRFLDERLRGTMVHWKGRNSQVCEGEECRSQVHDWPAYWKGWAAGEWWIPGENIWIPVVISGSANFELQTRGRNLTGQIWRLWKEGIGKKNWPMFGKFEEQSAPEECGPWFDMEVVLRNMVYPHRLILDVPNPTPAKIVLPVNASPGPQSEKPKEARKIVDVDWKAAAQRLSDRYALPTPAPNGGKINGHSREGAPSSPSEESNIGASQADDSPSANGKNANGKAGDQRIG